MHVRTTQRVLMTLGLIAALAIPVGCGGGSSGGVGGVACGVAPTGLTDSDWVLEETDNVTSGGCVGGAEPDVTGIDVVQVGTTLTITPPGDGPEALTLCGNSITIAADTFPEDGGTTSESAYVMTYDGVDRFTGSSTWTWTGPGGPCSGTTDYVFRNP